MDFGTLTVGLLRALASTAVTRLKSYGARAAEYRRLHRARRDPSGLVARLQRARSLLVVCHGNIIRSAFAAGLLAQRTGPPHTMAIASAGLAAVAARPADAAAVRAAAAHGVDLTNHAARAVTAQAVADADIILAMEIAHCAELRRRFPGARDKTFLLTTLAPDAPFEIADPFGREDAVFLKCFDDICRAVRPITRALAPACAPQ